MDYVGGDEHAAGIGIVDLRLPPSLIAGELDNHGVPGFAEIRDGFPGEDVDTQQNEQDQNSCGWWRP